MSVQIYANYYPIHEGLYREMFDLTKHLCVYYPNYEEWYKKRFIEGLKRGERRYIVSGMHGQITGCCLLKDTPSEKKISTFYVAPQFRRGGIGTLMMMAALQEFSSPTITFPEEKKRSFSPFLERFGFRALKKCSGLYRPNKVEYIYAVPTKISVSSRGAEFRMSDSKTRS